LTWRLGQAACRALGAADAGITIDLNALPASTLGNSPELVNLVFDHLHAG
jgi:hypothetical protein